ncbi:hypothetical protein H0H87_012764 [Tephrocybe sp. NHM501043]|nr:hypothetical protein H0H87_012764 [Tephrocybe sp. NHM501043]
MEEKTSHLDSASDVVAHSKGSQFSAEKAISKTVLAKMDVRLLPVLTIIYLLSFLDRTNVGNARVAGMQKDLNMTNIQIVGPDRMLPSMLTLWGIVTTLQAFAIVKMQGVGGKPGWAWLFFLEGLFSVLFGVLSFFLLPRSVDRASFLQPVEREEIMAQLKNEGTVDDEADVFSWKEVGQAFLLPQVQFIAGIFLFAGVILSSLA